MSAQQSKDPVVTKLAINERLKWSQARFPASHMAPGSSRCCCDAELTSERSPTAEERIKQTNELNSVRHKDVSLDLLRQWRRDAQASKKMWRFVYRVVKITELPSASAVLCRDETPQPKKQKPSSAWMQTDESVAVILLLSVSWFLPMI